MFVNNWFVIDSFVFWCWSTLLNEIMFVLLLGWRKSCELRCY